MNNEEAQTNAAGGQSVLAEVLERMRTRADNAYYLYIGKSRRDECLGQAIKIERGKFGQAELTAHCEVAEELGRHRALHEAAKMLEDDFFRIVEAIRAEEREACAKECDALVWAIDGGGNAYRRPADAEQCADNIRMRSKA